MDSAFSSFSKGSFSSSIGDSVEFEQTLTLSDRIKIFKSSQFDPNNYVTSKCQNMNEKEIKHLVAYLVDLKKASAEEMRISVYSNYTAFIRTSKEISDLEGELLSMRNLLSTQATLVQSLAEGVRISSLTRGDEDPTEEEISAESRELSKMEKWLAEFEDTIEVLLAERRVEEALSALDEGDRIAEAAERKQSLSSAALLSLRSAIAEQRQKLADQLAETMAHPSARGVELRSVVQALKKLGDGPRAHQLLLKSHQQKLRNNLQCFHTAGTPVVGSAYTAALSHIVFGTIAQAATDSLAVFSEESAYASELVTWAVRQTQIFADVMKRQILAPSGASGNLRAAAECVHIVLGHCYLLEARGLALSPVLLRVFKPYVEQALSANLKRIEQSSAALAAADDWSLVYSPVGLRSMGSSMSLSSLKLSSSAQRFNSMVQELVEDVGPLESLQLDGPALEGVLQVFNSYVSLLINGLPGSMENEENLEGTGIRIVRLAETEPQQLALLANASLLADELLPRAASRLLPMVQQQNNKMETPKTAPGRMPEQREWKKRLQRSVDRLRDSFCRQHALDVIFTEEGETRLHPQMYLAMDGNVVEEPEWFPSPVYQELFVKLTRIASIATDMFVGRERFATVLLIRLTETVILWLSDDQNFWGEIEEGPRPLGPFGLRQFYLDMEFVMLFASQGRYLSRHLNQVIKNIIARAIDAVSSTGLDPFSVLPEDDWFAEVAQIAIKMMTGKANFDNVEGDVTSPTASVYSQ